MKISMIVAIANNKIIGQDNKLVWHYPEDMKFFKSKTTGHTIIMGRKTYESIGKPLPNRRNIVLSQTQNIEGVECFDNIPSLIENLEKTIGKDEEVFVIGGSYIYKAFLDLTGKHLVDTLYITEIKKSYEGNIFFPDFENDFVEINREIKDEIDFVVYKRK